MSFLSALFKKKRYNIPICGLNGAGKTSILFKLNGSDPKGFEIKPTVGYVNTLVKYKSIEWQFWDVSGDAKLINLWRSYYPNVVGIVFVFDITDTERFQDAKQAFLNILMDRDLAHYPILVYINKIDKQNSVEDFKQQLGLAPNQLDRCDIIGVSAYTGENLYEGLDMFAVRLKKATKKE